MMSVPESSICHEACVGHFYCLRTLGGSRRWMRLVAAVIGELCCRFLAFAKA